MKELLEISDTLRKLEGDAAALATVVRVQGSAYRRAGARMLLDEEGQSWGMISGGCLEHDIFEHARETLRTGSARMVRYDSTSEDDLIFGTGSGCQGVIDVFVEPVTERFRHLFVQAIENSHTGRQITALATSLEGAPAHAIHGSEGWRGAARILPLLRAQMPELVDDAHLWEAGVPEIPRMFIQTIPPPPQLVVFGGWLDVVPLVHLAKGLGFQVVVVDARRNRHSPTLCREADSVLLCSPAEALQEISFDERTAVVLMNHHFERDAQALTELAPISVPYLGMLGPKRRQQRLLERLREAGMEFTAEFEGCLHGPVGLDLGARTPDEIALSIISEILAVLNGRNARPIRDRGMPIHFSPSSLAYA